MNEHAGLGALLVELGKHRYEIVHTGSGDGDCHLSEAVVRSIELEHTYLLTASDGWIQAMQTLVEAGVLESSPYMHQALHLALRLHARFLGCRFGFDEDNNLAVQYDIYPDMTTEHVLLALGQLYYVGSSTFVLFEEVFGGKTVDDAPIDLALADASQPAASSTTMT